MAAKENRRSQMTRLLLRTAFIELMQEKSPGKITIRELCERADLNRSTFYLHYTDPADLLLDIEQDVLAKTALAMKDIHTDPQTVRQVRTFLEYVQQNDMTFRTLLCRDDSERFRREFVKELRQIMAPNLPEYGGGRRAQYTLSFLMFGSLYVVIEWMQAGYPESAEQVARMLIELNKGVE